MYKNEKGFTLIEMLIVLLIISVLIILIVPSLSNSSKEINNKGCKALVTVVQAQVNLYELEKEIVLNSLDELATAGYITNDQKTCSNGTELTFEGGIVKQKEGPIDSEDET